GFAAAYRTADAPAIDGVHDEPAWRSAPSVAIAQARQFYQLGKPKDPKGWTGPDDLSGEVRFLWDKAHLYVGVTLKDDVVRSAKCDGEIWNQDGLQFLIDPYRTASEKAGKYDYSAALGTKGPQAWCHLSGHSSVRTGEAKAIRVAAKPVAGGLTYEVAIPWSQVAPFKPTAGANLGLAVILNEDDGPGRDGFMGWFSGVHSKQVDMVGDVILLGQPAGD
ncbi:MAG: sugar-binding protein, partial [Planctomycetota bacterium]